MKLYFDTSALIKKYISEIGSENVDKLLIDADEIYISTIGQVEAVSVIRRLALENEIEFFDYERLKNEINGDFKYYNVIDISKEIIIHAISMIDRYQLKSLDSIHLASAFLQKNNIDYFISCDGKLLASAKKEGFNVVNPKE